MSTYRSRLEAGVHPKTDPRREQQLLAELRRLADALTPRWRRTGDRDDFGSALLRIGARLAEQSAWRLDATAERDALAFFEFLGLPPDPPRAAYGVLVLGLGPKQLTPVQAAVATQVAVTTANGEQATFETGVELRLTPGGIAELFAVDPSADRIERAPAQVTSLLAPPALPRNYQFVTFSGAGSSTIQVSPAVGISAGDVLRVDRSAYDVAKEMDKNGLVLLQHPLEGPATPGSAEATRISAFETFTLRNIQRHCVFIAHKELLNLKEPAEITLELSPAGLAREMGELDIAYSIYGTRGEQKESDWQPLELLKTVGPTITLGKTWAGTADEVEVNGRKSRWIRAELREQIVDGASPASRASGIKLTVASPDEDSKKGSDGDTTGGSGTNQTEGSRTITLASHNGNPLATTGRFYPFGPEPIRFDTFALAAPEALSKKGATVTLDLTLADSSMKSFLVTVGDSVDSWSGYGVGLNGDLQIISQDKDRFRWQGSSVVTKKGERVLLGPASPAAIRVEKAGTDVLVAQSRDGRFWSASLKRGGTPPTMSVEEAWQSIDRVEQATSAGAHSPQMPVVLPTPTSSPATSAILLDVQDTELYGQSLDLRGRPTGTWKALTSVGSARPAVSSNNQLAAVQGADWPLRPQQLEVVARDDDNLLWVGRISVPYVGGFTVSWISPLVADPAGKQTPLEMSHDVAPTATRFRTAAGEEHWWVSYAAPASEPAPGRFVGIELQDDAGGGASVVGVHHSDQGNLAKGSELHTNPAVRGTADLPAVVGLASNPDGLLVWQADDPLTVATLAAPASSTRPQLLGTGLSEDFPGWEALLPGQGERLFRVTQPETSKIDYTLHNIVRFQPPVAADDWAPDRVDIGTNVDKAANRTMVTVGSVNRITYDRNTGLRTFRIDAPLLKPNMQLRFMRLLNNAKRYAGSFETPTKRKRVGFNSAQIALAVGTRLVIRQASYVVKAIATDSGGKTFATLDRDVAGIDIDAPFQVVDRETTAKVTSDDLGTLINFELPTPPPLIAFGKPAAPKAQKVLGSNRVGKQLWAILGRPWSTPPKEETKAVVPTGARVLRESVRVRDYRNPELSWEYFGATSWQKLAVEVDETHQLSTSGKIKFKIPPDLATTEIGGKEDYWIRARLIGGDYGRPAYLVKSDRNPQTKVITQTVVVDTTELNPPEIVAIEASFGGLVGDYPEIVLSENNADTLDQTQAATLASASFALFEGTAAIVPGPSERVLLAGFTGQLTAGPLTVLVDAVDQSGTGPLRAEVLTADGWQKVLVDDQTASMRRTGIISLSLQSDPVPMRLFGQDRIWLRFSPGSDPGAAQGSEEQNRRSWAPVIRAVLPNAVPVTHARTSTDEVLGSSLGAPGTTLQLSATPVLPDSVELRVREDLSAEELATLEEEYGARTPTSRTPVPPLVVTDLERAPGTWVLWRRVDSFIGQPRYARIFVLEPASGRVTFGDDQSGRIPGAGRDGIRAFSYQQGGGTLGNVPAWSETRMTTSIEGVEVAVLPLGVAGGADTPPPNTVFATAPHQLRHAGRALTPADVEALAVASSGEILRARCRRPGSHGEPIQVVVVVRDETSRCPKPTHAQREAVAAFIRAAAWGGLNEDALEVAGPAYTPLSVKVALEALPELWAQVEQGATARLTEFFDQAHGGPFGAGWPFGRHPDQADLLRVLNRVPGIDRVVSVDITGIDGSPLVELPFDGIVCAEEAHISVNVGGEGSTP
ncbi:baseplate J/gp47 family protein [Arthrobacter sp. Z4-13]